MHMSPCKIHIILPIRIQPAVKLHSKNHIPVGNLGGISDYLYLHGYSSCQPEMSR